MDTSAKAEPPLQLEDGSRHWRRNLIVCIFGSFTTIVAMTLLLPFLPIYVEELGVTDPAAIAGLPETQRLALVLRRYEELSYEEIATVLDLTVPAVKSLLFRARVLLREKLSRYLNA